MVSANQTIMMLTGGVALLGLVGGGLLIIVGHRGGWLVVKKSLLIAIVVSVIPPLLTHLHSTELRDHIPDVKAGWVVLGLSALVLLSPRGWSAAASGFGLERRRARKQARLLKNERARSSRPRQRVRVVQPSVKRRHS